MSAATAPNQEAFAKRVRDSLAKAQRRVTMLRNANSRLLVSSILTSAATTLVSGVTAAQGPIVGEGTAGWRLACVVAAGFGFATAVLAGVHQRLNVSERIAEATQCAGRLLSLDVALTTGVRDWDELTEEYHEIVRRFPELV